MLGLIDSTTGPRNARIITYRGGNLVLRLCLRYDAIGFYQCCGLHRLASGVGRRSRESDGRRLGLIRSCMKQGGAN